MFLDSEPEQISFDEPPRSGACVLDNAFKMCYNKCIEGDWILSMFLSSSPSLIWRSTFWRCCQEWRISQFVSNFLLIVNATMVALSLRNSILGRFCCTQILNFKGFSALQTTDKGLGVSEPFVSGLCFSLWRKATSHTYSLLLITSKKS